MASPDLRKLLLRVQTDADFCHLLLVDPGQALTGYSITPTEQEVLLRRDRSIYQFLVPPIVQPVSLEEDENPDDKPPIVMKPFPDVTLPPLHPIEIPSGGGFTLSQPPLTLTLGQPPPPPPAPPFPDINLPIGSTGSPPIPPAPPDPFFPIPPAPPAPLPGPPEPPDFPPSPPMFPETPEIFQSPPIPFALAEAEESTVPSSLISMIQQSSGEERAQAILHLLKMLDRREQ